MKPKALDLFCGAGGASMGLHRAGFDVTGVDINDQPRYPFKFRIADALRYPLEGFDFIWASPPCQKFTPLNHVWKRQYPDLIPQTRARLLASGTQYAIENVEKAPLGGNLIRLCGTMFGLQSPGGKAELRRHRIFETSFSILLWPPCQHSTGALSVVGNGSAKHSISVCGTGMGPRISKRRAISVVGNTSQTNVIRNLVRETYSVVDARVAMGIDWMLMRELSQAVPPAYSEFIGRQAIEYLRRVA